MTLTAAESLKNTWASNFRRKGGDGIHPRLCDHLDPPQQRALFAEFKLRESELPVIGSVQDSGDWLVLTTERLAWSIGGKSQELPTNAIRDATADLMRLQREEHSKLEMRQLQIVTMEGDAYSIDIEPGGPLSGTWNVLKNLGARNRSTTKTGENRRR